MNELVLLENRNVLTSSIIVAEYFKKRHDNVLRDIEELRINIDALKFEEIFSESTYKDNMNREQKMYLMNRDGFILLAMGFNGKRAFEKKIQFIDAFNKMEEYIIKIDNTTTQPKIKNNSEEIKLRKAELLKDIADKFEGNGNYSQIMYAHATKELTGEFLLPLPKVENKTYSATEIGDMLGISPNKVGRITKKYELKQSEYGEWFQDKSKS